jgi:hypothetical protein
VESTGMSAVNDEQLISGLSTAEAQQRLATSGYNELNPPKLRRVWHIFADVLREPMFLLLISAGCQQRWPKTRCVRWCSRPWWRAISRWYSAIVHWMHPGKAHGRGEIRCCGGSCRVAVPGGSAGLALVLSVPVLRGLFHFSGDAPYIPGVGVLASCSVLLLSAAVKRMMGTRN